MRALVTGGSSGIGLAFARTLAEHGASLVLVARDQEKLTAVAEQLRTGYAVDVETLPADLADAVQVERVAQRLRTDDDPVDLLINDAGVGLHASLIDDDTAEQETAIAIMVTAVLKLSGAAASAMVRRGNGYILNVASASAWIYSGNYSAIKRWVVSYTQALALELAGTGVSATAVCPGWVKTPFHERSGIERPRVPGFFWVDADVVATQGLNDTLAGKAVCIPSAKWRFAIFVAQHGPQAIALAVSRALTKSRRRPRVDVEDDAPAVDQDGDHDASLL